MHNYVHCAPTRAQSWLQVPFRLLLYVERVQSKAPLTEVLGVRSRCVLSDDISDNDR